MFVLCCSIHSWDHPPPAWPLLCPVAAVSVRPQPCSCRSTCRSWRQSDSVRRDVKRIGSLLPRFLPNAFVLTLLFALLDESTELQTQICNGFKSLVVQLQGELAAGRHSSLQRFALGPYASCFLFLSTEILNKCKGDLLEMKESKLKTSPSLLENLIFFVEVRRLCFHTDS